MTTPQILWLRRDLRIADQPALAAAAERGPVVPVYVLDDECAGSHAYGGASRWWLHHSLVAMELDLEDLGSRLILRRGDAVEQLTQISQELGGAPIHAMRHYEPWWRKAQGKLKEQAELFLYDGNYLLPPGAVVTGTGTPYKIYTPFSRASLEQLPPPEPVPAPEGLASPEAWPASDDIGDWDLLPTRPDWAGGMRDFWPKIGSGAAKERLKAFEQPVGAYNTDRNMPSIAGSSFLSPHLHFGEISPAQVWHGIGGIEGKGRFVFLKELIWRDYAQNVMCEFPHYSNTNYRAEFDKLEWRDPENDPEAARDLKAWQQGKTGYPIVDAGMRQLWETGWMHNRVRMIVASFLIKHLLIDWRHGEAWFWDTLVDADYASNGLNWQWSSGTGVDSNMFVRIMAPLSQSEKFDAADYIRRYVPELSEVDEPYIHDPPDTIRGQYPAKIIEHRAGRERALSAYKAMKGD